MWTVIGGLNFTKNQRIEFAVSAAALSLSETSDSNILVMQPTQDW
jgi:hypothetical protein